MAVENRFHIADIFVFGLTILISIGIGIYYAFAGGRQKTTSEFLLGGRLISFLPVAISLMVSFESSIMMLGIPAEGYVYGMQFIIGSVGFFISQLLSINLMVPLLHPLKITSAYEYLEYRFNSKAVRLLGTLLGMLTYCWYMGIVLFGPAVALEAVTGFPRWASMATISMVAVIYTSIGGLKAVVWTDVFQAFVMFAGIFAILIKGTMEVGGPQEVWDTAQKGGRDNLFVFDPDPRTRHTFFNLLFSAIIRGFGLIFNQSTVQRISSTKSTKEAKWVLIIVAPAFLASFTLALMEGIVAYAYYAKKGCDPFESDKLTNPNQIVPFFVMDIFENLPGMPGLFLASLFSASLSTLSSGLSSLSAVLWADIIHPLAGDISDMKATIIAKTSVLAFGALACGLSFLVSLIGGTLIQIASSVLSAFSCPVAGIFLMGCFCHRSNAKGAFGGGIIGLILSCWISFGMNFSPVVKSTPWLPAAPTDKCYPDDVFNQSLTTAATTAATTTQSTLVNLMAQTDTEEASGIELIYTLSYTWIAPIGILSTIFFGYIISLLTGPNKPGDVDPRYLLGSSKVLLIFMPARIKNWVSSLGPQFLKEEYKLKFPDPALRESVLNKELKVTPPSEETGEAGDPLLLKMIPPCPEKTHFPGNDGNGAAADVDAGGVVVVVDGSGGVSGDGDVDTHCMNGTAVVPASISVANETSDKSVGHGGSNGIVLHQNEAVSPNVDDVGGVIDGKREEDEVELAAENDGDDGRGAVAGIDDKDVDDDNVANDVDKDRQEKATAPGIVEDEIAAETLPFVQPLPSPPPSPPLPPPPSPPPTTTTSAMSNDEKSEADDADAVNKNDDDDDDGGGGDGDDGITNNAVDDQGVDEAGMGDSDRLIPRD